VKAALDRLVDDTCADELILTTETDQHADRLDSYRRVAGIASTIEVTPCLVVEA
jgi:hypothetical protein